MIRQPTLLAKPINIHSLSGLECYPIILMIDQIFDELYLVGGAVRDEIMGIQTYDLDFAVPYSADRVGRALEASGLPTQDNAAEYGTIATHAGLYDIQITSYRTESYKKSSRKPETALAQDIDGDLLRRDFTINAMALSRDEFIDPYDGLSDIIKKLIRTVGDANQKMIDDPLRMMRAYRFVSTHGFNIEKKTLEAIEDNRDSLCKVSGERLATEFQKLMLGAYWMDALYEMADSKLLSQYMRSIGFGAPVRPSSVSAITDQYTNSELQKMSPQVRWKVFFEILNDAEHGRGVQTLDIVSLINTLSSKLMLKKSFLATLIEGLENTAGNKESSNYRIDRLRDELSQLEAQNDPRSLIVKSKLFFEEGKASFVAHNYSRAAISFKSAVTCNDSDFDFIVKHYRGAEKDAKILTVKKYYIERYGYYLSALLMHEKWYHKYSSGTEALKEIRKRFGKARSLNKGEDLTARVQAVARVYRYAPTGFSDQDYLSFLDNWSQSVAQDNYDYLVRSELRRRLMATNISARDRIAVYKKLVEIARSRTLDTNFDFDYYDPLLDLHLWQCIDTRSLKAFWSKYNDLELATDDYMTLAKQSGRERPGMRRAYLNSAAALTHALSLTTDVAEKTEICRSIVASYIMAGYRSSKNVLRFKVLLGWLGFVQLLMNGSTNVDQALSAIQKTLFSYIDVDEEYLSTQLVTIAQARNNLRAVHNCLIFLRGGEYQSTGIATLDALVELVTEGMLGADEGLVILKNYCLKETLEKYEKLPFIGESIVASEQSEIESMIQGGESNKLEFKTSWQYSIYKKSPDKDISAAIVKTMAAFMNTDGGTILIGVEDDGTINGLESTDFLLHKAFDTRKRLDKIRLNIDDVFDMMIGTQCAYLKIVQDEHVQGKTIMVIKVEPAKSPVYVKEVEGGEDGAFYVRASASTRKLSTAKAVDYISEHFKSNV